MSETSSSSAATAAAVVSKAGTASQFVTFSQRYDAGTRFAYSAYLSSQAGSSGNALYVILERDATPEMSALCEGLVRDGSIPEGLFLFVYPGWHYPRNGQLEKRLMRAVEFDEYGPEFIDCILGELLPPVLAHYGIALADAPEMHFITGGSSGGMLAWSALWLRNGFFRRGWLSSPTFSAMRGGEMPMFLVRRCEPRPMRLYVTCGTEEPDYFFGDSFYAACNAKSSFECAGYDCAFECFPKATHCSNYMEDVLFRKVMRHLWQGWRQQKPIVRAAGSYRFQTLCGNQPTWEECNSAEMPSMDHRSAATPYGTYTAEGGCIHLEKADGARVLCTDSLGEITAIALSVDHERLYVADSRRRYIYAFKLSADGTFHGEFKHAQLFLAQDCRTIGATDCCIGQDDRLFAATELGIQCVCSFGLQDIILPLPGDAPAVRVALQGKLLYASDGKHAYRRPLAASGERTSTMPVNSASPTYGDGFDYSRKHFDSLMSQVSPNKTISEF